MKSLGLVFATLLLAVPCAQGEADTGQPVRTGNQIDSMHLSVDDKVRDILRHPAFTGHARLLLPWDNRDYDEQMSLNSIGSLLPYHSHVEPRVVVRALNRMIDDANGSRQIFYPFYSAEQRRRDPAKENTGLFYFRGKPKAPIAIIAPGGGFAYVGALHEGFPYAMEISDKGFNAFVLRYRAGLGERAATEDLASALSYLFANAVELGSTWPAIRYGGVPPERGWLPISAPTARGNSAAMT